MKKDRREFIKKTALTISSAGLAGTIGGPFIINSSLAAPSDIVNVGLIGCKGMGFAVLQKHLAFEDARCVAMCDVDENILNERAAEVEKTYGQKPAKYDDFRKLLENKDVDAVIISTPDHWHCLPMIYACEAGKDVYVEKPMANSIEECNLMVKAANKYKQVVQVGQQQRSGVMWGDIMKTIKSGSLGKLRKVEIWGNFNYGVGAKKVPDSPVPKGVDYNFWLGPAPLRETFNINRFHGKWRMFWDYGGGLMTDWGVHLLDMALWAGGVASAPTTILSYGANLSYEDYYRDTFDTMSVTFPMKDYIITWEQTAGTQNGPWDMLYGLNFICDNGSIVANRGGYEILPEWDDAKQVFKVDKFKSVKGREDHDVHARNFLDCIKSRAKTNCTPEIGRQVALYAHMANIAARTGEYKLDWDDAKNRFTNSKEANKYIVPEYRAPWKLPKL
jgi:predicted dehydrogenase